MNSFVWGNYSFIFLMSWINYCEGTIIKLRGGVAREFKGWIQYDDVFKYKFISFINFLQSCRSCIINFSCLDDNCIAPVGRAGLTKRQMLGP